MVYHDVTAVTRGLKKNPSPREGQWWVFGYKKKGRPLPPWKTANTKLNIINLLNNH